jgi:hypothetical protein
VVVLGWIFLILLILVAVAIVGVLLASLADIRRYLSLRKM